MSPLGPFVICYSDPVGCFFQCKLAEKVGGLSFKATDATDEAATAHPSVHRHSAILVELLSQVCCVCNPGQVLVTQDQWSRLLQANLGANLVDCLALRPSRVLVRGELMCHLPGKG